MDASLYQRIFQDLRDAAKGGLALSPSQAAGLVTGARRETTSRQLAAGKFNYPIAFIGGRKVVPIHQLAVILAGGTLPSLDDTSSLNSEMTSLGVPKKSHPAKSKKGPGRPRKYPSARKQIARASVKTTGEA